MKTYKEKDSKVTSGFICECGEKIKFPAYVYAHWRDELLFTCPACGLKVSTQVGYVSRYKETE
jgi:hypothetical protein